MIVRILSSSASFNGVIYNTNKIDKGLGELMLVKNFGPLQAFDQIRPGDYRNYLKVLSAQNSRVRKPQFHAAISGKGKLHNQEFLTQTAVKWLEAMGYGAQPYLIVFHKDTNNLHVHMVSTRVNRNGVKISSAFEKLRAVQQLNRVLGLDEKTQAASAVREALLYQFSTVRQFMMLLEDQGYSLHAGEQHLDVNKFGLTLLEVPILQLRERIGAYVKDLSRQKQLRAIMEKYGQIYDPSLVLVTQALPGGRSKTGSRYTSELAIFLEAKFGTELVFHARDGQLPYGYSIIDRSNRVVWKGSELISLRELVAMNGRRNFVTENAVMPETVISGNPVSDETKAYYAALLQAATHNFPDTRQGLQHLGLVLKDNGGKTMLQDPAMGLALDTEDLRPYLPGPTHQGTEVYHHTETGTYVPPLSLAEDIDDEQINGRNRRRKKKARTNTR